MSATADQVCPGQHQVSFIGSSCSYSIILFDYYYPPPGFRVDLAVKYQKIRGQQGSYPIKLFYTSNIPIILQTALTSNVHFLSQLLYRRWKSNMLVNLLGQWQEVDYSGQYVPVGGLAYYIYPPSSVSDIWVGGWVAGKVFLISYPLFRLMFGLLARGE